MAILKNSICFLSFGTHLNIVGCSSISNRTREETGRVHFVINYAAFFNSRRLTNDKMDYFANVNRDAPGFLNAASILLEEETSEGGSWDMELSTMCLEQPPGVSNMETSCEFGEDGWDDILATLDNTT